MLMGYDNGLTIYPCRIRLAAGTKRAVWFGHADRIFMRNRMAAQQ
jgi:hypothetical protein